MKEELRNWKIWKSRWNSNSLFGNTRCYVQELVESILGNGVLTPVIVRPDDEGGYEMISGHRRLFAVKEIGLDTIPAYVREMTDDDAVIAMVDSNIQREEILPSEKAFAYRMRYEAMRHQGMRSTSSQVGTKLRTDEELAEQVCNGQV